ncbi:type I restriction enzyme HsdR N-terminal domain-containing protein [Rhizobium sp. BK176]|uniref:type I restriction enzyme HsdR N-terminal domain-containing protein n=1 Tax=Rhizobium sp. BK176 TaxID=2587071 RepID=UPI00216A77FC|nr:type I restriction enzyme HsdR N-terminal domain-containing protein [Rhizobium sp. BK176]MCS4089295.1 hypothetical protein [Rhizobium sp. BK176]
MSSITDLIGKARSIKSSGMNPNEMQTRRILVDPLLRYVGWDVDGLDEVQAEYPVNKDRVDYAMISNDQPVLLVEAKSFKSNLSDVISISQAVNYGNTLNVPWCVLTNGSCLGIYVVHAPVAMPDKLFKFVDIATAEPPHIDAVLSLISKESVLGGATRLAWNEEWKKRSLGHDFHVRHSVVDDEHFRRAILGVELSLGAELLNEGHPNTFMTRDRRSVQFSKTAPYRGAVETGFVKITPLHLEADLFVIWKTAAAEGWLIPTDKLKAFLETIPTSSRTAGRTSWDPRIGTFADKDRLWTNMDVHGWFDVTPYRFSF